MKIDVISDLHLDHSLNNAVDLKSMVNDNSEIIIDAGDTVGFEFKNYSDMVRKYKDSFIVKGNHDFYCHNKPKPHLYYKKYDDITLIGVNGWYDFNHNSFDKSLQKIEASLRLMDFRLISNFTVDYCEKIGCIECDMLDKSIDECDKKQKIIVVTHVPPLYKKHPKISTNPLVGCFHNTKLESVLIKHNSKIHTWVCGHDHIYRDFYFNNTRIVSNPFGYPRERDNGFPISVSNKFLQIEV